MYNFYKSFIFQKAIMLQSKVSFRINKGFHTFLVGAQTLKKKKAGRICLIYTLCNRSQMPRMNFYFRLKVNSLALLHTE